MPSSLCVLALAGMTVFTAAAPQQTTKYTLDSDDSYIGFSARHMMVTTVKGRFKNFRGEVLLDEKDITRSSARIEIDAASISTENERRDNHLKSDDFLNAARFPKITFVSKRVARKGAALALVGDLTIRDVTKEVTIPFRMAGPAKVPGGRKQMSIEGQLTINRFDFNLRYNRFTESVQVVAPEIRIELNVAAGSTGT